MTRVWLHVLRTMGESEQTNTVIVGNFQGRKLSQILAIQERFSAKFEGGGGVAAIFSKHSHELSSLRFIAPQVERKKKEPGIQSHKNARTYLTILPRAQ